MVTVEFHAPWGLFLQRLTLYSRPIQRTEEGLAKFTVAKVVGVLVNLVVPVYITAQAETKEEEEFR